MRTVEVSPGWRVQGEGKGYTVSEVALRVEQVSFAYPNGRRAVDEVTFSVRCGEALAIVGPNGAGKTTLLAQVLGLLAPTSGRIAVFGRSPRDAVRAGWVGAMPQEVVLPAFARVDEMLRFLAALYPEALPLDEVVARAGIEALWHRSVHRLSGGERRRVQFAAAIVGRPRLLVCDEPTEGMDPAARQAFWVELRRLGTGQRGPTVVFSTHDLQEADRSADRVLLLRGGRVVLCDTPERIKRRFGSRRLRFRIAGDFDPRLVADALGVPLEGPDAEGWVEAWVEDSDQALVRLLAWRPAVADVSVETGSLDDVFFTVMGEREGQA